MDLGAARLGVAWLGMAWTQAGLGKARQGFAWHGIHHCFMEENQMARSPKPATTVVQPIELHVTSPKHYLVEIVGAAGLLMNRMPDEPMGQYSKADQTKIDHRERERLYWRDKMYYDPLRLGVHIPSENLHQSMYDGCRYWNKKIDGEGNKKYADLVKSAIVVQDLPLGNGSPMQVDDPAIVPYGKWCGAQPTAGKKGGKVWKIRPMIASWGGQFVLTVFDSRLTPDLMKIIITYAGKYKGVCDWRPKFGRYDLVNFTEVTDVNL